MVYVFNDLSTQQRIIPIHFKKLRPPHKNSVHDIDLIFIIGPFLEIAVFLDWGFPVLAVERLCNNFLHCSFIQAVRHDTCHRTKVKNIGLTKANKKCSGSPQGKKVVTYLFHQDLSEEYRNFALRMFYKSYVLHHGCWRYMWSSCYDLSTTWTGWKAR